MKPTAQKYEAALRERKPEILAMLRSETPGRVAEILEKEGWPREWACAAVCSLELQHNPANLPFGPRQNQETREKLQTQVVVGAGLFLAGLLVSLVTLASALTGGGLVVFAYGAIIAGAGMWMNAFPRLRKYPNRPLPMYRPPRDPKVHNPHDF